jgi:hypothetical protein
MVTDIEEIRSDIVRLLDMFSAIGRFESGNVFAGTDEGFVNAERVIESLTAKYRDEENTQVPFQDLANELAGLVAKRRQELDAAIERSKQSALSGIETAKSAARWDVLKQFSDGEHLSMFSYVLDADPVVKKVVESIRRMPE